MPKTATPERLRCHSVASFFYIVSIFSLLLWCHNKRHKNMEKDDISDLDFANTSFYVLARYVLVRESRFTSTVQLCYRHTTRAFHAECPGQILTPGDMLVGYIHPGKPLHIRGHALRSALIAQSQN